MAPDYLCHWDGFGRTRSTAVKQGQKGDLMSLSVELLGHLKGDDTPEREASQEVRTFCLEAEDLSDIVSDHLFYLAAAALLASHTRSHQPIDGLVRTQIPGQFAIEEHSSAQPVDAEEGWFGAGGLNRH